MPFGYVPCHRFQHFYLHITHQDDVRKGALIMAASALSFTQNNTHKLTHIPYTRSHAQDDVRKGALIMAASALLYGSVQIPAFLGFTNDPQVCSCAI